MPHFCCIVGCTNRSSKRPELPFYRIPKPLQHLHRTDLNDLSMQRHHAWIANINRVEVTTETAYKYRVCGVHFISGKKAELVDTQNADWAPTVEIGYDFTPVKKHNYKKRRRDDDDIDDSTSVLLVQGNCNVLKTKPDCKSVYLVDEPNLKAAIDTGKNSSKYTVRSVTCGELNREHIGKDVVLCGWLEFQRMDKFLVLRDAYGLTQCIIHDDNKKLKNLVKTLNYEAALQISGVVQERPKAMVNPKLATGEIEVSISDLCVLNNAKLNLPFHIREYQKAQEGLRMQYRYLDLRFSEMQKNLRLRSEVLMNVREFLVRECGFVEVETPTLFKSTPGGAQEFVVPTRHENKFYSLVQSPQQFKQMLMCGGTDRYFQIARCYRDETSRPDRQPEFTQLDIEMSFTTHDGVLQLVEDLLNYSIPNLAAIKSHFPRITYENALRNYGTDKPDVRFEFEIQDYTELLSSLNINDRKDFYAGCLVFQEPFNKIKFKEAVNHWPDTRMYQIKSETKEDFIQKTSKVIKASHLAQIIYEDMKIDKCSTVFLVFGNKKQSLQRLGRIRLDCADYLESQNIPIRKEGNHFVWVIDFPLFSLDEKGKLCSEHHPFTSPVSEHIEFIEEDPLKVRALSYDLVLNGNEIGGGSIRIHDAKLQEKVLKLLKIKELDHIVEMLSHGCPPHGGIALGIDRLMSCLLRTQSIRDVIAFPKTFDGKDPISGAPSVISDEIKKIYHLK